MARKYGKLASEKVERAMHEMKRGKLKSGRSGKKVTSRKQAIAIGLSQARRAGGKVPPAPSRSHATMKPGSSIDAKVRAYLSHMKPGTEVDAKGVARAIHEDALGTAYALQRAAKAGHAVTEDDTWYGPASVATHHASMRASVRKSPAQLDREIAEVLGGKPRHATMTEGASSIYNVAGSKFGIEIDPTAFEDRKLPAGARWRKDLVPLAEQELARGRSYRRPPRAEYNVIEWTSYRGELGKLLDWLEATPGITRYAEIFE